MPRSLSIGAKWALRYTLATVLTIFAFAALATFEIQRRMIGDAKLLLELEVKELAEEVRLGSYDAERIAEYVAPDFLTADPVLRISFQVFDEQGERVYGRGILAERQIDVPPEVLSGHEASAFVEIDIDEEYPYWATVSRAHQGYVQVGIHSRRFVEGAQYLRDLSLAAAPFLVVLAGALGWWLARQSLRPLQEITETARRISVSNLDDRIQTRGTGDELDRLALTLNEMISRIGEGVAKLHRFTVDAAHQLRTPLTALRSRIELLLEDSALTDPQRRAFDEVLNEAERLSDSVNAMLRLARTEAGLREEEYEQVALGPLLESVIEFYEPLAIERGLRLEVELKGGAVISAVSAWLSQLFGILMENAIRYTPAGGAITVTMETTAQEARVGIGDTGEGIPAGELHRVFDRFYRGTARSRGAGSGLGLAIARQIALAHGGDIEVESTPHEGSVFTVRLPGRQDEAARS